MISFRRQEHCRKRSHSKTSDRPAEIRERRVFGLSFFFRLPDSSVLLPAFSYYGNIEQIEWSAASLVSFRLWARAEEIRFPCRLYDDQPQRSAAHNARMADFRKLKVWQEAHALALAVSDVAGRIRGADHLSLRSQTIRAADSIDSNIVEGRGQRSDKQFVRFLEIAVNSSNELESHLIMARDRGVISRRDFVALIERTVKTRKMLHGLINKLEGKKKAPPSEDPNGPEPEAD